MNYELAKQLKDAGFPLISLATPAIAQTASRSYCVFCGFPFLEIDGQYYLQPVLDVLIAACGEGIFQLLRQSEWHARTTDKWQAVMARPQIMKELSMKELHRAQLEVYGQTPEEAVARLWLALNKLDK